MIRPLLLFTALLSGCDGRNTEVLVVIHQYGLTVPKDLDGLSLRVSDYSLDGSADPFTQPPVPLCADGMSRSCYDFPITLGLVPGPQRPNDLVRVEVRALLGDTTVIDDAATFAFITGERQRIDFVLYDDCLGSNCAAQNLACDAYGKCSPVDKTPIGAPPDLAPVPDLFGADLASGDLAGADLSAPDAAMPDFAGQDLFGADLLPDTSDLAPVERACGSLSVTPVTNLSYATVPSIAAYNMTGDFTLEAWVYPMSQSGGNVLVVGRAKVQSLGQESYGLWIEGGSPTFIMANTTSDAFTGSFLALNTWTHLAATYESANQRTRLWVSGMEDTAHRGVAPSPPPTGTAALTIGCVANTAGTQFTGLIDEVRLSTGLRYTADFTPAISFAPTPSDVALFHFNEAGGSVALDSSPNANAATLVGDAVFSATCQP